MRLCHLDGFVLELDTEIARTAIDAGWPAVELLRCRNGHSLRLWPEARVRTQARQGLRPCAVCGLPLPDGAANRRAVHVGACTLIKGQHYRRFVEAHPGKTFFIEEAPWYRGILAPAPSPLPPLDPLAGRMPRDWAAGWLRLYSSGLTS